MSDFALIGLVDGFGSGGASDDGKWSLVFNLAAWREPGGGTVTQKRRCELPVQQTELRALMDRITGYTIVEVDIDRVSETATILRRIVRTGARDAELEKLSADLQAVRTIERPPFPLLTWTKYEMWEGTAVLPAWRGFQSRGGPYGAVDSAAQSDGRAQLAVEPGAADGGVAEYQARAFQFQLDHGQEVVGAVLKALLPYYTQLRADWRDALEEDEELARAMPRVSRTEDFRSLIGLAVVHVHPYHKDGLGYVGLEFGCTWDEEHGFGVMLHGARVVEIGDAAASFAWKPDEAEG